MIVKNQLYKNPNLEISKVIRGSAVHKVLRVIPDLSVVELRRKRVVGVSLDGDVEVHQLRHLRQPLGGRVSHRL